LRTDTGLVPEQAVSFKVRDSTSKDAGIVVTFQALEGETVLNGLQIRMIY